MKTVYAGLIGALALLLSAPSASAAFRIVRTGTNYTTFNAAMTAAINNDTIEIDSGTYIGAGAMATIPSSRSNITVRGVGPTRPILDANFSSREDKGILVVYGTFTTVENIEFRHARSSSGNGAGIRQQGNHLTVRHVRFDDCEDGILNGGAGGSEGYSSEVLVEYSEFHECGNEGFAHGMYISPIRKFTLQHCWMHRAKGGHEIKTRAGTNYILYNRITNEGGGASYEVNIPNGGTCYVIGNIIEQTQGGGNPTIIDYLSEGIGINSDQHLYVMNNTILNRRTDGHGVFVKNYSATTDALLQNNIFQGPGTVLSGRGVQISNWATTNAFLADVANYDYRLTAASVGAIDMGTTPSPISGVDRFSLLPVYQYVHPYGKELRPSNGARDIGAYEYVSNQPPTVNAGSDQTVIEGQAVQLHAAASDPNNDALGYTWTQSAGLNVTLNGGATADASFTTPTVNTLADAAMTFTVSVSDGKGGLASDSVNVRVCMRADANQDDVVDVVDLLTLVDAFGSLLGDANYDATCDFNNDGAVDVFDLLDLVDNFGRILN